MGEVALDKGQLIAPLQCPLSSQVLSKSEPWVRQVFGRINDARLGGSQGGLDLLQERLAEDIAQLPEDPPEPEELTDRLILEAALGDCLSIVGRWDGCEPKLIQGVELIERFVHGIQHCDLGDQGATRVRAHAYLGNALTRLGYVSHDPRTLRDAVRELENRTLSRRALGFPPLSGSIHRDLGDAYIGQLHWNPEVPIDGAAIKTLRAASRIFAEVYADIAATGPKGEADRMFDEWAASQSSLAVALSKTALELQNGAGYNPLFLEDCSLDEVSERLVSEAHEIAWGVWRVYLGLLSGPGKPRFRWARTISNVAFASLYVYQLTPQLDAIGMLSEAAFLSVLDGKQKRHDRLFDVKVEGEWFGDVVHSDVCYNEDDHPHRFSVNCGGLVELGEAC